MNNCLSLKPVQIKYVLVTVSVSRLSEWDGNRGYGFTELRQHMLHERHSAVPQVRLHVENEVCGW